MRRLWAMSLMLITALTGPLGAVEPAELLADPALEARARALSQELRCPVCRNESIDESHATLARELRLVLRERLLAGDSDAQIRAFMVARYGEFVLLRPDRQGVNLVLWLAPGVLLLLALGIGLRTIRCRAPEPAPLSAEEQQALDEILRR